MAIISFFLFFVLSLLSTREAESQQVDASAGTYSCYPCGRAECGLKDGGSPDVLIEPPPDGSSRNFQPISCQEFQREADYRRVDPEMCSYYSQVTRSSSNPCECRSRIQPFQAATTNGMCIDPNQPQACNLCGHGKIIGDPEKVLPSPYRSTCASFYDLQLENLGSNQGGFSNRMCNDLKTLFAEDDRCKCVVPGTPVTQCLLQLDFGSQCNPNQSDDQCCIGGCKWLDRYQKHLCTTQPGDVPPPTAPSSTPTTSPLFTTSPSLLPTTSPSSLPTTTPSVSPSATLLPSTNPSISLSPTKSLLPSSSPSSSPSLAPTKSPSLSPSSSPTVEVVDQAPPLPSSGSSNLEETAEPRFCTVNSDCPSYMDCWIFFCFLPGKNSVSNRGGAGGGGRDSQGGPNRLRGLAGTHL